MIGFYNYTVVLTYLSLISGVMGIIVCLNGIGHPFIGIFFLMLSGLCDTFDGKVARTKKDRSDMEKGFGIQIDSLADMVAFGVLPSCIGMAMLRVSERFTNVPYINLHGGEEKSVIYPIFLMIIALGYVLAALIRLAYFNVLEEERQKTDQGSLKYYIGLPVTSAALIFPTIMLIQYLTEADHTMLYFGALAITGLLFVTRIHVTKPNFRNLLILVGIGAAEFILLIIIHYCVK